MKCDACKRPKSICISDFSCVPFETNPNKLNGILNFFLYRAPSIKSSLAIYKTKSTCIDNFASFLKSENVESLFIGQSAKISKSLTKLSLGGNHFCIKCSRFVCKRKNPVNGIPEEDYEALLRHIRNAIAHGNVFAFFEKNNTYLVFDDYSSSDKSSLTARVVLTKAQMERLKVHMEK